MFWGFDGVQGVCEFDECLYLEDSYGLLCVVLFDLQISCMSRVLCFVAYCFLGVISVQDFWSV